MVTKLFKIGEEALFGKWRVTVTDEQVQVEGMSWIGEQMEGRVFHVTDHLRRDLDDYLNEKMTSYWAEKLIDFVSENVEMPEHSFVVAPW